MISDIQIKNFRSVVEATIDLRYGEDKAPKGHKDSPRLAFLTEKGCAERFVPCLALFGSNANGKTNLLQAVAVLQQVLARSQIDVRRVYDPNRMITCPDPTAFKIGFVKGAATYEYAFAYSASGMLSEWLVRDGKTLFAIDAQGQDFTRIATKIPYTAKGIAEIFKVECRDGEGCWVRPFLNTLGHRYAGLNAGVTAAFDLLAKDLHVMFMTRADAGVFTDAVDALCRVMPCDRKTALDAIVEIIRKLDVEITNIDIVEQDVKMDRFVINSSHENDRNERVVFDFMTQESEGTIRLASVVAFLLCALHRGDPVFVDELDRSLHPLLVRELLAFFQQRAQNGKNAQLVFSTHCTDLLDDEILRLSEIGIVIKNAAVGTKVKRLCDFRREGEDIRNVGNFRRLYLDGFYSGVPYPAM